MGEIGRWMRGIQQMLLAHDEAINLLVLWNIALTGVLVLILVYLLWWRDGK